jgi:hypothetical protein
MPQLRSRKFARTEPKAMHGTVQFDQLHANAPARPMGARKIAYVLVCVALVCGLALLGLTYSPNCDQETAQKTSVAIKHSKHNTSSVKELSDMIERAEKYLRVVDDWQFEPIENVIAARAYLQDHPRMSKYASAFSQVITYFYKRGVEVLALCPLSNVRRL